MASQGTLAQIAQISHDKADIKKGNGKKIVKNSRVSISEEEGLNFVKGRIDNKDIQLLLDMGAQISVKWCLMQLKLVDLSRSRTTRVR